MDGADNTSSATGDQMMSAAKAAIRAEFPDAAPTFSAFANRFAKRVGDLLSEPAPADVQDGTR